MRTTIKLVRKRVCVAAPWLPWAVPSAVGGADALNIISPSQTLYLFMLAFAAAITAALQGSRLVCRAMGDRWERAAEKAQVGEAATLIYQLASEHLGARQEAAERPAAVGDVVTERLPALHLVHSTDTAVTNGNVYRGKVPAATAAVPQQPGRPRLASARNLRRQP